MITIQDVIADDLAFTSKVQQEANILFMKPSLIHKLIEDAKTTGGTRYIKVTNNQVYFVQCPIVTIAENYPNNYVFLDVRVVEMALQFYKYERFDTFSHHFADAPVAFDMAIPEHLVDSYKRWQDTIAILEYQQGLNS